MSKITENPSFAKRQAPVLQPRSAGPEQRLRVRHARTRPPALVPFARGPDGAGTRSCRFRASLGASRRTLPLTCGSRRFPTACSSLARRSPRSRRVRTVPGPGVLPRRRSASRSCTCTCRVPEGRGRRRGRFLDGDLLDLEPPSGTQWCWPCRLSPCAGEDCPGCARVRCPPRRGGTRPRAREE